MPNRFLREYVPALKYGAKILNSEIQGAGISDFVNQVWYVDEDNGSDTNNAGDSPRQAYATIQAAVTAAASDDLVLVRAQAMAATDTDPNSYAETVTIAAAKSRLKLVGVNTGRTQGGLPQIKKGSGSTALLTVRSPGVLISGLGFNGVSATGGGILLDDDGGSTKTAFGTTIENCHFKNCVGSTATSARTGGAIQWAAAGNSWQVRIASNRFYKNVGDIVLLGTSGSVPQDVVIEGNVFSGPAASVDCNLALDGGSGMNGVIIDHNVFTAFPALGSGAIASFMDLTGCVGVLSHNFFGSNGKTFGAGANVDVPTTVLMAGNYQEKSTSGSGEIFRT